MDKIIFEDLPSEKTAINSENLNKVQTNIENALKGVATAYLSADGINNYAEQYARVPLNEFNTMTDKLTFNLTNNAIIIGKDVKHIEIEAFVNILTSDKLNTYGLYIYKNNVLAGYVFLNSKAIVYDYFNMNCKIPILEVKEGDFIQMQTRTLGTTKIDTQTFRGASIGTFTHLDIKILD